MAILTQTFQLCRDFAFFNTEVWEGKNTLYVVVDVQL